MRVNPIDGWRANGSGKIARDVWMWIRMRRRDAVPCDAMPTELEKLAYWRAPHGLLAAARAVLPLLSSTPLLTHPNPISHQHATTAKSTSPTTIPGADLQMHVYAWTVLEVGPRRQSTWPHMHDRRPGQHWERQTREQGRMKMQRKMRARASLRAECAPGRGTWLGVLFLSPNRPASNPKDRIRAAAC